MSEFCGGSSHTSAYGSVQGDESPRLLRPFIDDEGLDSVSPDKRLSAMRP
jgi:hypothetical protein